MKSSKRSLLRMSIFQNLWLTWINQPINKYEWLLYMCHLLVIQIYSIFQTTVKILITTIQKETLRAAGLKKQRPDEVHFLNQSIFPATTIPPQQLRLDSSNSLDFSVSLLPSNLSTTKFVASAQIHPTTVSFPPSVSSSGYPCLQIELPQ